MAKEQLQKPPGQEFGGLPQGVSRPESVAKVHPARGATGTGPKKH
jgi:hypothetical protein